VCSARSTTGPPPGTGCCSPAWIRAASQRWSLRGEICAWNDKCLDVYGALNADGTTVQLYTCHGGANQRWTIYP